jgi:hypothetical protein
MPICHCLVPDGSGTRLLFVSGPAGWSLPSVEHGDEWFAHEAVAVARQLSERLGLRLVALREIEQGDQRLCELENLSPECPGRSDWRWVDPAAVTKLLVTPASLRDVLLSWFGQSGCRRPPAARAPWEQKGWYKEAVAWIHEQLDQLRYTPTGPVEQVKTAWSCSSILRAPTTAGKLYFKATYARPPAEVLVIKKLERRWPRHVPCVVASDQIRCWMLMEDFGPRELSGLPFARWPGALRLFGRLQRESSESLWEWQAMACPDRRMDTLAGHLEALFSDPLLEQAESPFRLSTEDRNRLMSTRERWADELCELGASPLPISIVQQDFRDGNIAVRGRDYVFYDWSDTVLSHPFFSASRFLDFVPTTSHRPKKGAGRRLRTAVRHERLLDAYLDAWEDRAPRDRLRSIFRQVRRLDPIYQAIRWYMELPYCEHGSPWWRIMLSSVAESLQDALKAEAGH